MKEPDWEELLRNWTPRRASSSLREKLFSPQTADRPVPARFHWNWLAPATIGAFTTLMILAGRPHLDHHFSPADTNLFFASAAMNILSSNSAGTLSNFALSKRDLNLEQNIWREASFASTNPAQTRSSMHSLPDVKTNSLIR
ncbi:MAG: hypothetical protein ABJC04_08340 [Verrucomicrobiota bacterium]